MDDDVAEFVDGIRHPPRERWNAPLTEPIWFDWLKQNIVQSS